MTITEFIDTGCGKDEISVIYKLTNLRNNKIYIGQTKNSLRKRILSHLSQANQFTKLRNTTYSLPYRNTVMTILVQKQQKRVLQVI